MDARTSDIIRIMEIRKAEIKDRDQLLSLLYEFADYYITDKIFPNEFLPFVEYENKDELFVKIIDKYLTNNDYIVYVAEENEKLVGYIVGLVKANSSRVLNKEGFIEDWFVSEELRDKGIGRQLFEALLSNFKQSKCNYLKVEAYASNKSVIDIYHKMGFIDSDLVLVKKFN